MWDEAIPQNTIINLKNLIVYTILFLGIVAICGFIYLRDRSIRSLNIKYYLHQLSHLIRDEQTKIHQRKYSTKEEINEEITNFLYGISEIIKVYFCLLTNDKSIEIAIRLAVLKDNNIVYKTYVRSTGLNPNRRLASEDIAINEGLPKFLRSDHNAQGVIIYHDFIMAAQKGAYKTTKNDTKFPNEIKTAMVAPMNAWDGTKQDMIGILFVTSKNNNTFSAKYVDSVAYVADIVASAISNCICHAKNIN